MFVEPAFQESTEAAVRDIQGIGKSIDQISDVSATIAAAMEQQGAATQEISRNVQEAAAGTQTVLSTVDNVQGSTRLSGEESNRMFKAAGDLLQEAEGVAP